MKTKGHLLYYPEGKYDVNLNNYVLNNQLNDALKSKVDSITKVTWQLLKDLRDNSQLTPGSLYRITDYQCTTTQENTQSAGHQFDIVLLALSENKLAEEGWAMMHDNIYDVTFTDGVTKKCYLYKISDYDYNIVVVETMLGIDADVSTIIINEDNKTATWDEPYNITGWQGGFDYNYFQNSKLEAWKVWYCLDNDKSRFAWADDSVDEDILASITYNTFRDFTVTRNVIIDKVEDGVQYYGWGTGIFTKTLDIVVGETDVWNARGILAKVSAYTPAHEGTNLPNGRGVIYRLIDEWGNDVPYDFKNIQIENKGYYYLFSAIDPNTNEIFDCSSQAFDGAPSTGNVISMPQSYGAMNLPTGYFMASTGKRLAGAGDNLVLGLDFIIDNYAGIESFGKIIGYSFYE